MKKSSDASSAPCWPYFGGIGIYLLAVLLLYLWRKCPEPVVCEARDPLYLTTNGLHLNFVMPTDLMAGETLAALTISESAAYVSFGWGDRGFYLRTPRWKDLRLGVAAKALFWKSETAMHIDYYWGRAFFGFGLLICDPAGVILAGWVGIQSRTFIMAYDLQEAFGSHQHLIPPQLKAQRADYLGSFTKHRSDRSCGRASGIRWDERACWPARQGFFLEGRSDLEGWRLLRGWLC